jgi:predicted MFS family arabinose efflux permease
MSTKLKSEERRVLLLLAAIQFLAFLDFEFMMPLGPYIGPDLHVNASQLGELVSAYTFAGMVGALVYARYADRWDKRSALLWLTGGLAVGTLLCGLAPGYWSLLAARVIAGMTAGPAGAAVLAIASEVVPEERRGQGMGIVFGGFTAASVAGLPVSVALADHFGWRRPFIGLALISAALIPLVRKKLPRSPQIMPSELLGSRSKLYRQPIIWLAWSGLAALMIGDFAFVPFMPSFLTGNLGIPKSALAYAYAAGGLTTLVTFQGAGKLTDRFGSFPVHAVAALATGLVLGVSMRGVPSPVGAAVGMGIMAGIFFVNAPRVLSAMTLFTKAPSESQRGEFLALQNVVQQGAIGLGSLLGAYWIGGSAGGRIEHSERLLYQNWIGLVVAAVLVWKLEQMVRSRDKARA